MKDPLPPSKNNRYGTRCEHVLQEFKCNTVVFTQIVLNVGIELDIYIGTLLT